MTIRDENDIPLGGSGEVQRSETPPGVSIIGLGLGALSVVLCWVPFLGLIGGIMGIAVSFVGINKWKTGIGVAGIALSIVGTVLSILLTIIELFGLIHIFH